MELKQLPDDLKIILSQWLDTAELLTLMSADLTFKALLNYKVLWLKRAKCFGIYRPEFDELETVDVKARLVAHMRILYRQIRGICPQKYARLLTTIVLEDDATKLQAHLLPTATGSATALMPIAMQYGRVRLMHSLFTHFGVSSSLRWLLMAIHDEYYAAVKYLVEIFNMPLVTDQPYQLFPAFNQRWDPTFALVDKLGRHHHTTFVHYNELLLIEIIRCRHPKIVNYLKRKLEELNLLQGAEHPQQYLYLRLKRHSVEHLPLVERCDSPELEDLQCPNKL